MYYNSVMRRRTLIRLCVFLLALCAVSPQLHATKKPPLKPVNINTATSEELQEVPGIGPVTAGKILQMRKSYGAFRSVDDLRAIKGIGPKRLAKMRKYLTVGKEMDSKAAQPPAKPEASPHHPPDKP
jgi:comEA protein